MFTGLPPAGEEVEFGVRVPGFDVPRPVCPEAAPLDLDAVLVSGRIAQSEVEGAEVEGAIVLAATGMLIRSPVPGDAEVLEEDVLERPG